MASSLTEDAPFSALLAPSVSFNRDIYINLWDYKRAMAAVALKGPGEDLTEDLGLEA